MKGEPQKRAKEDTEATDRSCFSFSGNSNQIQINVLLHVLAHRADSTLFHSGDFVFLQKMSHLL